MIRWKKSRIALALGLTVCLAVGLLSGMVSAADEDFDKPGTVTLLVNKPSEVDPKEVKVDVFLAANIAANGVYSPVAPFNSGELAELIKGMNLNSPLGDMAEMAKDVVYPPTFNEEGERQEPELPEELHRDPGCEVTDNVLSFSKVGLYLVIPRDVVHDEYTYSFMPMLLSVPALGTDGDAANGRPTPAPGVEGEDGELVTPEPTPQVHLDWQYDYSVYLKPQENEREASLRIHKFLDSYNESLGKVMFVFKVSAYKTDPETNEDKLVFSKLVEMVFSGPGDLWSEVIEGIPAGSRVVIEEIYTGGKGYVCVTPNDGKVEIQYIRADSDDHDPEEVEFRNTYDKGINPGTGVVNTMTFVSEANGQWNWSEPDQGFVGQGDEEE